MKKIIILFIIFQLNALNIKGIPEVATCIAVGSNGTIIESQGSSWYPVISNYNSNLSFIMQGVNGQLVTTG